MRKFLVGIHSGFNKLREALFKGLLRARFRYDVFISYSHRDAKDYALNLKKQLSSLDFACFIDEEGSPPGVSLDPTLEKALRKSAVLVLLATGRAITRPYIIQEFKKFTQTERTIIPINIADTLTRNDEEILKELPWDIIKKRQLVWIDETEDAFNKKNPSPQVADGIDKLFRYTRRNVRVRTEIIGTALLVLLLAIGAGYVIKGQATDLAEQERLTEDAREETKKQEGIAAEAGKEAERQLGIARKAEQDAAKQLEIARKATVEADRLQQVAKLARAEAEKQQKLAENSRKEAAKQSRIATSRRSASMALAHLDDSLDYAMRTSLDANDNADTFEAETSLFAALHHSPNLMTFLGRHDSKVRELAFSPTGHTMVTGDENGNVYVWDLNRREILGAPLHLGRENHITALAFSANGKRVALAFSAKQATAEDKQGTARIVLLDAENWKVMGEPIKAGGLVLSLALNTNGDQMLSAGFTEIVLLWKVTASEVSLVQRFSPKLLHGLSHVSELRFTSDGQKFAALVKPPIWFNDKEIKPNERNVVLVWNISDQTLACPPLRMPQTTMHSISFINDEAIAVGTGEGEVILYDTKTQKSLDRLEHTGMAVPGLNSPVLGLAFNKDENLIISVTKGKVLTGWDISNKKPKISRLLKGLADDFATVAFNPNGKLFATGSPNGQIVLWDVGNLPASGKPVPKHFKEVKTITFDPTRNLIAAACDGSIFLWDINNNRQVKTNPPNFGTNFYAIPKIISVAFNKNGTRLVSGGSNGVVTMWNWNGSDLRQANSFSISGISVPNWRIEFTNDLSIVSSIKYLEDVSLWSGIDGKHLSTLPAGQRAFDRYEGCIAFSPDGKTQALVGGDGELLLLNITDPKRVIKLETPKTSDVLSVGFNNDGSLLAAGTGSGIITIWSVEKREPIFSLRSTGAIHSIAFSPNRKLIATGNNKGEITLWDIEARQILGHFLAGQEKSITSLAFNYDDTILASGDNNGIILWDVSLESWKKRVKTIANLASR